MPSKRGVFISMEGGEGSGKSTQLRHLVAAFEAAKLPVLHTREPGGTDEAELIRNLLVQGETGRWDPIAETLLFYAARREHWARLIEPALAAGTHVICDRFSDSSRVYQGCGKELGDDFVLALHHLVLGNVQPDLTLWLDLDPTEGITRALSRPMAREENRFENTSGGFHERVRAGFIALAKSEPQRVIRIEAGQDIAEVHSDILRVVADRLGVKLTPVAQAA